MAASALAADIAGVAKGRQGALRVQIRRAEGLAKADINGKADPYVKAVIRHMTRETRVVHSCLDPVWNEPLEFLGAPCSHPPHAQLVGASTRRLPRTQVSWRSSARPS